MSPRRDGDDAPADRTGRSRSRRALLGAAVGLATAAVAISAFASAPEGPAEQSAASPATPPPPAPVTSPPSPTPPPAPPACPTLTGRLTVVSYNIESGQFGGGALNLPRIADAIASWHPDVVLLQEVDRFRYTSGRVDMPAYFARRLGMHQAFGVNVRRSGNSQYGTAILSRFPLEDVHNTHLPWRPRTQQRGLLRATITPHGVPIAVYNTHLENTSEPARLDQARSIAETLAADPTPKIIGGDFNSAPASPVLGIVETAVVDSWAEVGAGPGRTVPSWRPRARIDFLLHGEGLTPVAADVPDVRVSDHRPVRASYTYGYRRPGHCRSTG